MEPIEVLTQLRLAADKSKNKPIKIPKVKDEKISMATAKQVGDKMGINWNTYSLEEFYRGMNVELEHSDVTNGDLHLTAKITMAHLREVPNYYKLLEKYVEPEED